MTGPMVDPILRHFFAATLILLAAGCGSPKGLVPVEGRVTFAGKQPPGVGYLSFVPREMSVNLRHDKTGALPGSGFFSDDGVYRAGTFNPGDGLRPGTYEVRVECSAQAGDKQSANDSHSAPVLSLVPSSFVPPDLVVPRAGSRPVRFDVDVR